MLIVKVNIKGQIPTLKPAPYEEKTNAMQYCNITSIYDISPYPHPC